MIAAVPSVLVQRCLNIKAHRSGVYFSSLSFFNTSCFPSCPMAPNSTEVMWGPGLIATVLYGISFGQYIFYLRSFPKDSKRLKLFIMTVL
ncbi:hypothetical protein CY34DRAFT_533087 [Suillus luteus UH-Slu-Lm8-n1]|uniref:Uncharacterized protein n=1 Tax=Suillus luteus UH-Slu-Lm8-n1 TaxID=930992 RepID=A0A0D0A3D6_9AGAM|nr:hypothetical protein CY34DRAFT_533087 [Suillus luteus UH-Slu-Lm8-n1]